MTLLKWFFLWLVISCVLAGVCSAETAPPTESSLREKLAQLSTPTPLPEMPPMPEVPAERRAYFENTRPVWTAYWAKEQPRLLALGNVCQSLIADYPGTPDATALEQKMVESYLSVVGSAASPDEKQARERIDALLARPDLPANTAEAFYSFQMNMIAIISSGDALNEIVPVTHDGREIPDRIRQVVEKFAARYPGTEALGKLCLAAAQFLMPGASFAHGSPLELREKYLQEADKLGDKEVRAEVAKIRFRAATVGHEAPPVAFTALDGRKVDLAEMRGKVVVLDFWATWCGPCMEEMPKLHALYDRLHERGLEVVGISLDSERETLEKVVRSKALPWPQCFDGKGWESTLGEQFGVRSIPETWVIGRTGQVVAISPDNLASVVEAQMPQ